MYGMFSMHSMESMHSMLVHHTPYTIHHTPHTIHHTNMGPYRSSTQEDKELTYCTYTIHGVPVGALPGG
jgi:hypothetical protein